MLDTITAYIIAWIPTILGLIGNVSIVATCFANWKRLASQVSQSTELKQVISQNKILIEELRKANRLNRELLTKIDKIQRGEWNDKKI